MAVGVRDVEVPLAPGGVGRFGRGGPSGGARSSVHGVDVVDEEDDAPPDPIGRLPVPVELDVHEAAAGAPAGERVVRAAVVRLEAQIGVEGARPRHVGRHERDGVDRRDPGRVGHEPAPCRPAPAALRVLAPDAPLRLPRCLNKSNY